MFDNVYVDMAIDEFYRGGQENNFLRMRSNKDRMPTFAFLHKVDAWVNGEEVQFDDWVDENKVFSKRPGSCDTWNNVVIKRVEMYVNGKCPKDHLNGRMIVDYQWENGTLVGLNARFGKIMWEIY